MFWHIFRFELRYHLRRPSTYLYFAVLFLLAFGFLSSDAVEIGGARGKVLKNAPYVLTQMMIILTAVGQVITAALVGTSILRDFQLKTHELLFTTSISRAGYLGGRFLGALAAMLLVYAAIPLGAFAGTLMPWVDAEKLLPFSATAYVHPFLVFVVPNVVFISALFFSIGALTRNQFAIYTLGIFLLVAWSITGELTADLENQRVAGLVDAFGLTTHGLATRYWTVAEKKSLVVAFADLVLWNRLLWCGIAAALVGVTYAMFRFQAAPATLRRRGRIPRALSDVEMPPATLGVGALAGSVEHPSRLRQLLSIGRFSFAGIVKEVTFLSIATIGMVNVIMSAWYMDESYSTPVYPVTYLVAEVISGAFAIFFVLLLTIYVGDLVWRERDLRTDQVVDALPVSPALSLTGRCIGLMLAMLVLVAALIVAGILVQTLKGFHDYELGLYLRTLYLVELPFVLQYALLAFFVHVLVNNKQVGHFVMIVFWVGMIALSSMGLEHRLWRYGNPPAYTYSDMNGFGHFVPRIVWFNVYWTAFGLVLGIVAYLFWVRGTDSSVRHRLALARTRLTPRVGALAGTAAFVTVLAGAFIFYNTNVLHAYRTGDEGTELTASYEKTYRRYRTMAQPRITAVRVRADLFPERRAYALAGSYTLVNQLARPVDTLFLNLLQVSQSKQFAVDSIVFSRPASRVVNDTVRGVYLYRLATPLAPGDSMQMRVGVHFAANGFPNGAFDDDVAANGTFVNSQLLPVLGYSEDFELSDDDERKKQKLPPKERMPSLDDESARVNTYIAPDADWITFEATVSTAPDQIALAPGYLQRTWMEDGRRVFHYRMDAPILNFYSFLSARYAVKRDRWRGPVSAGAARDGATAAVQDVAIEVYHEPGHEYDVDRMIASVKKSLDYFTTHFSPYQHRQVRILEFPRYRSFAQAFPNTIPYSEAIGFISRVGTEDDDIDMPFFVTAHEVAHQWWAHQVIGANMQGSTSFSEGLAEYSALTVMEKEYGQASAQKFLRYELDRYLMGRSAERKKELPIMLVENQPYIHYNKAALAFYALRDYIGEDSLNAALSRFLRDKSFQSAPYTTSREFLGYLRAVTPDSLRYVITDLFETITLYDNKVEDATVTRRPDGRFAVRLVVDAKKLRADSLGEEKEIAVGDYVDVGVFGERQPGNKLGQPLYLRKHRITAARTAIDVVVDREPRRAGIDPYNKLIDRDPKDNVKEVTPP